MQNNSLSSTVPSFAKVKAYDFDESEESFALYQELSKIAEEIEECRSRNC